MILLAGLIGSGCESTQTRKDVIELSEVPEIVVDGFNKAYPNSKIVDAAVDGRLKNQIRFELEYVAADGKHHYAWFSQTGVEIKDLQP